MPCRSVERVRRGAEKKGGQRRPFVVPRWPEIYPGMAFSCAASWLLWRAALFL